MAASIRVIVVAVISVVSRVIFRRPWTVEVCSETGVRHELHVVGWRRAGKSVRSLGRQIESGQRL